MASTPVSVIIAPTVIAPGALAGEYWQASEPPSPAATTTVTPEAIVLATAWLSVDEYAPLSDKFATDGPEWFLATQSNPAIITLVAPFPLQSRTRTDLRLADLA